MSQGIAFYPWLVDWRSVSEIFFGGFGLAVVIYLWLRAGRDRLHDAPTGDKPPVHDYAGIIQSGTNKVPTFLIVLMIGISLWSVYYIIQVAMHGLLIY